MKIFGEEGGADKSSLPSFFSASLAQVDPQISEVMEQELARQQEEIALIAAENMVSRAVLEAQASVLSNKYAEGYPGRRYYGGCQFVDVAENLAIERAKKLFNCAFANVQSHSGSQANQAVMMALAVPGDTIMGLDLACGGHLTHGARPNQSGKWFNAITYGVRPCDAQINFDEVETLAKKHKPRVIIAGGSAYPRIIDFVRFRQIADEVEAYLLVDMAHFAGLVAGGVHPNPIPHAHVVTMTTHKTLRGPRGAMVLTNDEIIAKKVASAVFPGMQGGPFMHAIAAKAVAFGEALQPAFRDYARAVCDNAVILTKTIADGGFEIVSGGTDTHLLLVDLRPKNLKGRESEVALCRALITCNKNAVPFDPEKPTITSGIRLGTAAGTTRGFGPDEFKMIGEMVVELLDCLAANGNNSNVEVENSVRARVKELCAAFPIY